MLQKKKIVKIIINVTSSALETLYGYLLRYHLYDLVSFFKIVKMENISSEISKQLSKIFHTPAPSEMNFPIAKFEKIIASQQHWKISFSST